MSEAPIARVLRPGLVPGPHPDAQNTWLVFDPESGNVYELSEVVWEVAAALDGASSASKLADELGIGRRHVQDVLRKLEALDMLVDPDEEGPRPQAPPAPQWTRGPVPERFELVVHPEARFRCVSIGVCCEHGYVIPVRPDQVEGLRAAARARGRGARDPVTVWPGRPGEPWGYALDNDEGCPFFGEDRRCAIHEDPAQPEACQVFPFVFAQVGERVLVSQTYRCGCGVGDDGPRLVEQVGEIERRLRMSPHLPVVPARARLDASRELDGEDAAEILRAAAEANAPGRSAWGLLESALSGLVAVAEAEAPTAAATAGPRGPRAGGGPNRGLERLRARLRAAAGPELAAGLAAEDRVEALVAARAREASPAHESDPAAQRGGDGPRTAASAGGAASAAPVATLRRRVQEAGLQIDPDDPSHDGEAELARFVRDHLFGLRPFQQVTLTHGLALLALLIEGLAGRGLDAIEVRAELMAWDDLIPQAEVRRALTEVEHALAEDAAALLEAVRGVAS